MSAPALPTQMTTPANDAAALERTLRERLDAEVRFDAASRGGGTSLAGPSGQPGGSPGLRA